MTDDKLADLAARARAIGGRDAAGGTLDAVSAAPIALSPAAAGGRGTVARQPRIGLVLAGGGAKGAYQAGVVQRIADAGIPITALAGCSIGALNGAVIAAAPDLPQAAARLAALWQEVSTVAGSARVATPDQWAGLGSLASALGDLAARTATPVLRPGFLAAFVRRHLDAVAVQRGIPLWVSVFPTLAQDPALADWSWLLDLIRSKAGASAEWLHVNALPADDVHRAVLASAALPVILPSQRVQGRVYRDGGLADITAAGALVRHGNCDLLIVTHLDRATQWDAHQYPDLPVIEIRPRAGLRDPGPLGGLTAILDFSPQRIRALGRQGYEDAADALDRAANILGSVTGLRRSQDALLRIAAAADPPAAG
jgi:NTE family protein